MTAQLGLDVLPDHMARLRASLRRSSFPDADHTHGGAASRVEKRGTCRTMANPGQAPTGAFETTWGEAVQQYSRSSAGATFVPEDVRPPEVLRATMAHLRRELLDAPRPEWHARYVDKFDYMENRFRAVRMEWKAQCGERLDAERLHWTTFMMRVVALRLAICGRNATDGRRLVGSKKGAAEQLQDCFELLVLQFRADPALAVRAAHTVAMMLLFLGLVLNSKVEDRGMWCKTDEYADGEIVEAEGPEKAVNLEAVYKELEALSPAVAEAAPVQQALRVLHCLRHREWVRFFCLCRELPFTTGQRCLLSASFAYVRFRALLDLATRRLSLRPGDMTVFPGQPYIRHGPLPAADIADALLFRSVADMCRFAATMGLGLVRTTAGAAQPFDPTDMDDAAIDAAAPELGLVLQDDAEATVKAVFDHVDKLALTFPPHPAFFGLAAALPAGSSADLSSPQCPLDLGHFIRGDEAVDADWVARADAAAALPALPLELPPEDDAVGSDEDGEDPDAVALRELLAASAAVDSALACGDLYADHKAAVAAEEHAAQRAASEGEETSRRTALQEQQDLAWTKLSAVATSGAEAVKARALARIAKEKAVPAPLPTPPAAPPVEVTKPPLQPPVQPPVEPALPPPAKAPVAVPTPTAPAPAPKPLVPLQKVPVPAPAAKKSPPSRPDLPKDLPKPVRPEPSPEAPTKKARPDPVMPTPTEKPAEKPAKESKAKPPAAAPSMEKGKEAVPPSPPKARDITGLTTHTKAILASRRRQQSVMGAVALRPRAASPGPCPADEQEPPLPIAGYLGTAAARIARWYTELGSTGLVACPEVAPAGRNTLQLHMTVAVVADGMAPGSLGAWVAQALGESGAEVRSGALLSSLQSSLGAEELRKVTGGNSAHARTQRYLASRGVALDLGATAVDYADVGGLAGEETCPRPVVALVVLEDSAESTAAAVAAVRELCLDWHVADGRVLVRGVAIIADVSADDGCVAAVTAEIATANAALDRRDETLAPRRTASAVPDFFRKRGRPEPAVDELSATAVSELRRGQRRPGIPHVCVPLRDVDGVGTPRRAALRAALDRLVQAGYPVPSVANLPGFDEPWGPAETAAW